MSKRETHIYHKSLSSTVNMSLDEMISLANSLKISTQRFIQKKDYSCLILITISYIDKKHAKIKVGFRGKKSIVKKRGHHNDNLTVNPHLHIVVFANPGETISEYIEEYIEKKLKGNFIWSTHAYQENSWRNYVKYDMEQAIKERTVSNRIDVLPQELVEEFLNHCEFHNFLRNGNTPVFKNVSNKYFEKFHNKNPIIENDPFTLSEEQEIVKPLDTSEFETILENQNNYNVIYRYNKYNKLNKLDNSYDFYLSYKSDTIINPTPIYPSKQIDSINTS